MKLHDFNNSDIHERLAETIDWCVSRAAHRLPDVIKIRKYLERYDEATALMREAYAERDQLKNKLLHRAYQKSEKYRRGVVLLQEADPRTAFSLATQLRSAPLTPPRSLGELQTEEERVSVVLSVLKTRTQLLQAEGGYRVSSLPGTARGRLLVYCPNESVSDGASEHTTRGFFDVDDVPPWDTWVAYSGSALLSWVPAQLVDLVEKGIDVNPVQCIQWLD
jgi:hypothetical protein